MRYRHGRHRPQILGSGDGPPGQRGVGRRGPAQHQVGSQALDPGSQRDRGRLRQQLIAHGRRTRLLQPCRQ